MESCRSREPCAENACFSVFANLNLIARRQECIEAENQIIVALEQLRHTLYDFGCVDGLCLELLHYIQEMVINRRLAFELGLDLLEICKGILDLELTTRVAGRRTRALS
jgi:hypothetical protein